MPAFSKPIAAGLVALAVLVAPSGPVRAQTSDGGIYDGTHHEPPPGVVGAERRAGVAAAPAQARAELREEERLNAELLRKARHDAQRQPPSTANAYGVSSGGVVNVAPVPGGNGGAGSPTR